MKIILSSTLFLFILFSSSLGQWKQLAGGPYGGDVSAFAVKGTTLFAGTRTNGLYRSTDGGGTWVHMRRNGSFINGYTSFIKVVGETIVASHSNSWIRSSDNGDTWQRVGNYYGSIISIVGIGATLYHTTSLHEKGELLQSTDYGDSWDTVAKFNHQVAAMTVIGTSLFVATKNSEVYHTNDNCKTWKIGNESLTDKNIVELTAMGTNLYATTGNSGVFRSTNYGDSWTAVNTGMTDMRSLKITASETSLFVATMADTVFRSTNNGDSWTPVFKDYKFLYPTSITAIGTTIYLTRFGEDKDGYSRNMMGGVFRSKDNGDNWTRIGITSMGVCGFAMNNSTLFAGTIFEGVFRSTDGGVHMFPVGKREMTVYSVSFNETTVFAGADSGIFRSTDNGDSWVRVSDDIGYVVGFAKKGSSIFAGTSWQGVFRSTDNGDSWVNVSSNKTSSLVISGNAIFTVGTSGLYRSTDDGHTWIRLGNQDGYSAVLVNGNTVFAAGDNGLIYRSSDYGDTWTTLNTGPQSIVVKALVAKGNTVYVGTLHYGILRSFDNGETWSQIWSEYENTSNKAIMSLLINNETLYAGTGGYGAWKIDLSTLGVHENNKDMLSKVQLICYPNPATNSLTIDRTSLQFPENAPVHYTLSTIVGGKVMEFDNNEPKFTVPLDGIVSGVYCLTAVSSGNRSVVIVTVVE